LSFIFGHAKNKKTLTSPSTDKQGKALPVFRKFARDRASGGLERVAEKYLRIKVKGWGGDLKRKVDGTLVI
jgi:hypothetical protein